MTISAPIALFLLAAFLTGVGSLGMHYWSVIELSKARGFFDNGLGARITREEKPLSFKAAIGMYWFGVAGALVIFAGGLIVMVVVVTGR